MLWDQMNAAMAAAAMALASMNSKGRAGAHRVTAIASLAKIVSPEKVFRSQLGTLSESGCTTASHAAMSGANPLVCSGKLSSLMRCRQRGISHEPASFFIATRVSQA
jgi:hypothetical protein